MSSRRTGPTLLDKNVVFLNTKGLCLLCYEECPLQTQEKRRATTQTSVNFTRLVSRYLGFTIDNVVVAPLKKVGRKCVIKKDEKNGDKVDNVGFELCDRCAALAHAFCQVQFQVQFHQMILDRCVRSISEIIKEANKKTTAELFTMAEDDDAIKKQQKSFTRLSLGGLRSANILRTKLYKKSLQKLSKSFPIIKLKRICKSGDWIPLLDKHNKNGSPKNLPMDSQDVILASLLGCVVSFWIVLSLSFINPEEYAQKLKEAKSQPKKSMPLPIINCDELEIEIKFPSKKKSTPKVMPPPKPPKITALPSASRPIAQQSDMPPSKFQPVVIHKHPNQIVQISKSPFPGSQVQPPSQEVTNRPQEIPTEQYNSGLPWKSESHQYPIYYDQNRGKHHPPTRVPIVGPSLSSSSQQMTHPIAQYPHQAQQYPIPPPPQPPPENLMMPPGPSSSYASTYPYPPATPSPSGTPFSNTPPPVNSPIQQPHAQYNYDYNSSPYHNTNGGAQGNYNYSYNFTTYNYSTSSNWPSYNTTPIVEPAQPPPPSYSVPPTNGSYDAYSHNSGHESGRDSARTSNGYEYGYDYNNYIPPSQTIPNSYPHHQHPNPDVSSQYMPQSTDNMPGGLYSEPIGDGASYIDNNSEPASYTTLAPRGSSSSSTFTDTPNVPMDVDTTTSTSTSDEPSLTHEDPQTLDSENSSMNGDAYSNNMDIESETDTFYGEQSGPQPMFPEIHWRQQPGISPPISCKESGCTEQFITQGQLQLHLRTHGNFQCSFCHLTFSKAHNLAYHEKMRHCKSNSTGNKSKCPRCDFSSTSQYKYFLHFLTDHLNIPLHDKPCQICNKPFIIGTKTINRKNHFRHYHDVEGKDPSTTFTCKGCTAPFLKDAQLRDHQLYCTAAGSVSSPTSSVPEITYNTAVATADQIVE